MEIDPAELVRRVTMAYEEVVQEVADSQFITVSMPREGTKSFQNCVEVHEWALAHEIELPAYFKIVLALYDPQWCQKNFSRPYPPFGVASSVKVLLRVENTMPKSRAMRDDSAKVIENIVQTIRAHPMENWDLIRENVFAYLPFDVMREVKSRLGELQK